MRKMLCSLLLLLWGFVPILQGQEVHIPQSVVVPVGRLAAVEMTYVGDDFTYVVPPELDAFREYTTDPKVVKLRVMGFSPGTYSITAVAAKAVDGKGKLSPFVTCLVVVGSGPVPPTPIPIPPGPPIPPDPTPVPVPIPSGPRTVLIVRESSDDTPSMSRLLVSLSAGKGHDYLKSKGHGYFAFDTDAKGSDGKPDPKVMQWISAVNMLPPFAAILDSKGNVLAKMGIGNANTADDVLTLLRGKE